MATAGLHSLPLAPAQTAGLPFKFKLLPEYLKNLGYERHLVGKWHLGYSSLNYTPTYRGFESFYGMYTGPTDYYNPTMTWGAHRGIDFWNNKEPVTTLHEKYVTNVLLERAKDVISNRNKAKPLFLYMPHQATHSAGGFELLQAPQENTAKFPYIGVQSRTTYAGMVDSLDQTVGELLEALEKAGMLKDTILVFASDNGGDPYTATANQGYNWPLRGTKATLWEGGVRSTALVWSPRLTRSSRVSTQLMHATDWLPTLYAAAGGRVGDLGTLDGVNMWQALSQGTPSPRTELLHEIDDWSGASAIRFQNYKLVVGNYGNKFDTRFEIVGGTRPHGDLKALRQNSKAAAVLKRFYGTQNPLLQPNINDWSAGGNVSCGQGNPNQNFVQGQRYYLFDLSCDPCELHNLASTNPQIVSFLLSKLAAYNKTVVPTIDPTMDSRGFPENNNGLWGPWIF
ncbi:arylsulfatase B-like [Haemaphysalis longicornis]